MFYAITIVTIVQLVNIISDLIGFYYLFYSNLKNYFIKIKIDENDHIQNI
jgi:hypothetical protein